MEINEIIFAVMTLVFIYLAFRAHVFFKEYIGQMKDVRNLTQLQYLEERAFVIVCYIQQMSDMISWEDRKQRALTELEEVADTAGIEVSFEELDRLVESAVYRMKSYETKDEL